MEEDEVGKTYGTDDGEQKCIQNFGGENAWKTWSFICYIILKCILKKWNGKVWI